MISSRRSGSCRQTCDGAWPGVSTTVHAPTSVSIASPSRRSRSERRPPAWPVPLLAAAVGPAPQWLLRHAALAARPRSCGRGRTPACSVHPGVDRDLAAGALGEHGGLAGVIGVRVGEDDQLDVLDPVPDLVERALEVGHRPPARAPRCRRARARRRPAAPTRYTWGTPGRSIGIRSRHTPGRTRSPRPTSRGRVGLRTGGHATVPAMAKKGRRRERIRAPEFEYRDEHGSLLVLRGSMTPATRMQYAEVAGGNTSPPLAGGCVAARGRVPVRAPGRAMGHRRHRADHAPEGVAGPATASPRPTSGAGSGEVLREHLARALSGYGGPVNSRRVCAACWPTTASTSRPGQQVVNQLDDARHAAAAGAPARTARARGVAAAARRRCRARTRGSGARRATPNSTASRSAELAEAEHDRRLAADPGRPTTRTRWPASTRRGWPAPRAAARRCARSVLRAALGDHAVADRRPPPSRPAMGTRRLRGVRGARAVPRPRRPGRGLGRAARRSRRG